MLNGQIDLRSDTVTQPTDAMREAMMAADLGDDVFGDDPTVNALEKKAAELMEKEAALFVPSGTMANLLAIMTQTRPGDSVILSDLAHPLHYEAGNAAHFAGVTLMPVNAPLGILMPEHVEAFSVSIDDVHLSQTKLVMMENTVNFGGGSVYPVAQFEAVAEQAHELGMRVHCDGARIFNACVASGVAPGDYGRHVDTLSFCLSKGLGCPAGSVLVGDRATIHQARRYRKALGGGMRQVGLLAAAGIYALDNHVDRLAEDHAHAARFCQGLADVKGIQFYMRAPTNLVYMRVKDAFSVAGALGESGVLSLPESPEHIRVAFNLHIDDDDVERAITCFREVIGDNG